jgi:transcription elongation factor Elf1
LLYLACDPTKGDLMAERKNNQLFEANKPVEVQDGMPSATIEDLIKDFYGTEEIKIGNNDIPLPSLGALYPTDHPFYNRKNVVIRNMRASDEDILMDRKIFRSGKTFSELIRSCVVEPKLTNDQVRQIILGDYYAILSGIRITGYGIEYKTNITCPKCSTPKIEHVINMQKDFTIRFFEKSESYIGEGVYTVELPTSKTKIDFTAERVDEVEDLIKFSVNNKSFEFKKIDLLMNRVVAIHGKKSTKEKTLIRYFLERLPPDDMAVLSDAINEQPPKFQMKTHFCCPNCGHEAEEPVTIDLLFFRSNKSK